MSPASDTSELTAAGLSQHEARMILALRRLDEQQRDVLYQHQDQLIELCRRMEGCSVEQLVQAMQQLTVRRLAH
jgi:hypothetical protein